MGVGSDSGCGSLTGVEEALARLATEQAAIQTVWTARRIKLDLLLQLRLFQQDAMQVGHVFQQEAMQVGHVFQPEAMQVGHVFQKDAMQVGHVFQQDAMQVGRYLSCCVVIPNKNFHLISVSLIPL